MIYKIKEKLIKYLKALLRALEYIVEYHFKKTFAFLIFLILYCALIGPSSESVNHAFSDNYDDILSEKTEGGLYNPNTDIITNYETPGTIFYKMIQLHELCHRIQHYENRSRYDTKMGAFLDELECNIASYKFWKWHTV